MIEPILLKVMNERTWDGVSLKRPANSSISAHPTQQHLPDPNDEQHLKAIKYWIQLADFYRLPHLFHYDSIDHLAAILSKLSVADLMSVSQKMDEFNIKEKQDLLGKWTTILRTVAYYSPNRPH